MMTNCDLLSKIASSNYPVAFTGDSSYYASGLNSYKYAFHGYSLEGILTKDFYNNNYDTFIRAIEEIFQWTKLQPSNIHIKLNELQIPIITESMDGLHLKAGSKHTIELLGNLNIIKCTFCSYQDFTQNVFGDNKETKNSVLKYRCPICYSPIQPDIVLRGESVKSFHLALNEIYNADFLLVINNNLTRWPANKLVSIARTQGCEVIQILNAENELVR